MIVYKLTDKHGRTHGHTQWKVGVRHEAVGTGTDLCTDGWIYGYTDPLIALLRNPADASFLHPRLWEAETDGEVKIEPLKLGAKGLTVIRELPVPKITSEIATTFAILCALTVYPQPKFVKWAHGWLDGTDRSAIAAGVAAWVAAWSAAWAAAWAAASGKPIDFAALAHEAVRRCTK